ncbi:MAG: hypothetical protein L6V93_17600 [Clostridiales bacterium]|nr:MAG: hypothetical protein L6V93_17600 [Clostridiales bacterium]
MKIEEQPNVEEEYFTDLDGHWAGKLVSQFVKNGRYFGRRRQNFSVPRTL